MSDDGKKDGFGTSHSPSPSGANEAMASETSTDDSFRPSSETRKIAVGDVLSGIYRITRFIARNGISEVYEGVNVHAAGERVAIKVIVSSHASDELVLSMFAREAAILTRLHHEAIVPYRLAARDALGRPFIVTEYIDGLSLEERFHELQLTDLQFGALTRRLARGLGAAHALEAIHRNIAPDKILLAGGDVDQPKIIDFGIARGIGEDASMIGGEDIVRKLKYIAPEQLGEYGSRVGPWTDLYSLALTLLAVATGKHADMGDSISDAVRKRMSVPDLSAIPAQFRAAFEGALQPDPAVRPQTADEFLALLDDPQRDRSPKSQPSEGYSGTQRSKAALAVPVETAPSSLDRLPGGKKAAMMAVGALLLLLVVVVIFLNSQGASNTSTGRAESLGRESVSPPGSLEVGTQEFDETASLIAKSPPCSWLSYDGANSRTARFVGGAGDPAAAQSKILDELTAKGARNVILEMGDAIDFDRALCGTVDALRAFRSDEVLVSSPERRYEAQHQSIPLAGGGSLAPGMYAKPLIRISGLRPDDEIVLLQIEEGRVSPLFASRAAGQETVELLAGSSTRDGFELPFPAEFNGPNKESYGIAVVAGQGPFKSSLFGDPDTNGSTPIDAAWPDRFRSEARSKGWKTDIFWFSIVDETPG